MLLLLHFSNICAPFVCTVYHACEYISYMHMSVRKSLRTPFNRTPQVGRSEPLHSASSSCRRLIQWSPCGEMWCSFSSGQTESASFQSRHHQQCHRPRLGRKPSPWRYPFVSACTCCFGASGEAAWCVVPTHRSWTPWWMGTNETLSWSQLETWCHMDGWRVRVGKQGAGVFFLENGKRITWKTNINYIRLVGIIFSPFIYTKCSDLYFARSRIYGKQAL